MMMQYVLWPLQVSLACPAWCPGPASRIAHLVPCTPPSHRLRGCFGRCYRHGRHGDRVHSYRNGDLTPLLLTRSVIACACHPGVVLIAHDSAIQVGIPPPLQTGGLPPAWRVRFPVGGTLRVWKGSGAGSGGCNDAGPLHFNGGAVSRVTCVIKWRNRFLMWACWDGLYRSDALGRIPNSRLLASFKYPGESATHRASS